MTVKELMEVLKSQPEDMRVTVSSTGYGYPKDVHQVDQREIADTKEVVVVISSRQ